VQRVAVLGPSGAGKTTLSRRLARVLGVPHLELDALHHQPGWTELDRGEFRRRVGAAVAGDGWVVDGNYSRARDLVLARADTVVWLRPRRLLVLARVLRRTARRVLLRQELWNGNHERLREVLSRDPERSIVAWAWRMHGKHDEEYAALQRAAPAGQAWVVLRTRRDVQAWADRAAACAFRCPD
jgi:adenylate kinase family enzyme